MDEILNKKVLLLREALNKDKRIIALNNIEKEMNDSEDVMRLAYQKDMALDKYSDALKTFGENTKEAEKALKELASKKKELDLHPLVAKYNTAYKNVRLLYEQINNLLFGYLNTKACSK